MSGPVIVLVGAPGSGKSSQGALLARLFQAPLISTGDLLRAESLEVNGELVGDDVINPILTARISRPDCRGGFILDGYPRTVAQAARLDQLLDGLGMPRPTILHLTVPPPQLLARLTGRMQCSFCGRTYNVHYRLPAHKGFCDDDGMPLIRRADDREEVIRERLGRHTRDIAPVVAYYREADLHRVDGSGAPGAVLEEIESALRLCTTN